LRVGVLEFADNAEMDREIVQNLSAALGATPVYVRADAHKLIEDLKRGQLHVVIGGLPKSTPFSKEVGLSDRVGPLRGAREAEDRVIAVRPGENGFLLRLNEAIASATQPGH
jgi:hypothetical protein